MDFLAVQGTLKSLLQHHSSKASITWCSALTHKLHDIILSYPSVSDFSSPLPPHRPFFSFQRLKFPRSRTLSSFSSHSSCPPTPRGPPTSSSSQLPSTCSINLVFFLQPRPALSQTCGQGMSEMLTTWLTSVKLQPAPHFVEKHRSHDSNRIACVCVCVCLSVCLRVCVRGSSRLCCLLLEMEHTCHKGTLIMTAKWHVAS